MSGSTYDLIVVGGGVMGASAALRAASGGMRVALLEQDTIGRGASGSNAGTLSLQIKRVKLMPYALEGHALWREYGDSVGYRETGGLTVAFTDEEAELLNDRMCLKRSAGAPIRFPSKTEITEMEPGLSNKILSASFCAADGYANSSLTGQFYRRLLNEAKVHVFENTAVTAMQAGYHVIAGSLRLRARRLLLATGGWLKLTGQLLGLDLPITTRINTVSVSERSPSLISGVIGHATGLLTMKQKPNGSVLIGGGWQGVGSPDQGPGRVSAATLIRNLQLATHTVPALAKLRLLRAWTGYEAHTPDFYPLAGAVTGWPNLYVLGAVRGGYTIGPYIGRLMGDLILERPTERPLFPPSRFDPQDGVSYAVST
ncbi:MAG: FAD-dependent oxidoreductase [Pseudomonadota bacterium]